MLLNSRSAPSFLADLRTGKCQGLFLAYEKKQLMNKCRKLQAPYLEIFLLYFLYEILQPPIFRLFSKGMFFFPSF